MNGWHEPIYAGIILAFSLSPSEGRGYDLRHGFSGADAAAFELFWDTHRAYYLPAHGGLQAGDQFQAPADLVNPDATYCFGANAQYISESRVLKKDDYGRRDFQISGHLLGILSAGASVEVLTGPVYDLSHVQVESLRSSKLRSFNEQNCPWLTQLIADGYGDGQHMLVAKVILAEGWVRDKSTLRIEGDLNASDMAEVAQQLEGLGILNRFEGYLARIASKTDIAGEYIEETNESEVAFPTERAVAFVPYSVNGDRLAEYLETYIYKTEELEALEAAARSPAKAIAFLRDRSDLVMESGSLPPLLQEGPQVIFDVRNPFHAAAQWIDILVLIVNFQAHQAA